MNMYKIDKIDCRIVDLLMTDGRQSASEIARELGGISERVVRYRIERMVTAGVIRICAIPDPKALGYAVVADVFIEADAHKIQEIARQLVAYEFITYVAYSIGEKDISVQVIAQNSDEIYRLAADVIGNIPGVRKTTTSIVPITLKDVYDWKIPASVWQNSER
jgi:Lrp/AsnC family transcriptional regulator, regulator for asnA, asnC and gidA